MSAETRYAMLLADLGYTSTGVTKEQEAFLTGLLTAAQNDIIAEGAVLDPDSVTDDMFVEGYAAWRYRKRAAGEAEGAMPQFVRKGINRRICQKHMAVTG